MSAFEQGKQDALQGTCSEHLINWGLVMLSALVVIGDRTQL